MRVAILASGPSIRLWPGRFTAAGSAYELVLALNAAVEAYPLDADWWCAHDHAQLGRYVGLPGSAMVYASRHAWSMAPLAATVLRERRSLIDDRALGLRETDLTLIGCLHLVLRLAGLGRPLQVDGYGCDWSGTSHGVPSLGDARPLDWPKLHTQVAALCERHPHLDWRRVLP